MTNEAQYSQCDCKIGRNIDKYGLQELNAAVQRRREEEQLSLRDLAFFVNTRIVAAAIDASDAAVAGDATAVYTALTGDDVAPERRASVRNQLSDVGIDVEELTEDFVSYQAVRYHLQNCLEMDTGRHGIETIDEGQAVVSKTRERDRRVIERTLNRLQRVGAIDAGSLDVTLSLLVTCTECGESHDIDAFLDREGCGCNSSADG